MVDIGSCRLYSMNQCTGCVLRLDRLKDLSLAKREVEIASDAYVRRGQGAANEHSLYDYMSHCESDIHSLPGTPSTTTPVCQLQSNVAQQRSPKTSLISKRMARVPPNFKNSPSPETATEPTSPSPSTATAARHAHAGDVRALLLDSDDTAAERRLVEHERVLHDRGLGELDVREAGVSRVSAAFGFCA